MESDKWDKERMKRTMEGSKQEFLELNYKLVNLLVDFGLRALKTSQEGKKESLNPLQVNQIVTHEIEAVIENLSDPTWADLIIRKAEHDFYANKSEPF